MDEASKAMATQKVAVGGMTCANCEILVARLFKELAGVDSVRVDHKSGQAEIDHRGELSVEQLHRAVTDYGYSVAPWDENASLRSKNTTRDYAEIAGILLVLIAIAFALQQFGFFPHGFGVSESMSLGLVFLIGLVASVSSCMAVTGGLLVAAAAAYNERTPNIASTQRFLPHLYFNAGRIVSYGLFGAAIGALGSALTLSAEMNGILTIAASAIMIVLGLQMLGLLPRLGSSLFPRTLGQRIHQMADGKIAGGAFTLGALTFFLPCGFTQALQLYVLSRGGAVTGAVTMLVFALGTLPALLSLSAISSFARGTFQKRFLRFAGAAVLVLGFLNIEYGLVLTGLGSGTKPAVAEADATTAPVVAAQIDGKQVVSMRVVDFTYMPAVFQVKQGIPVEWRIDASQAVGCGLVILAPRLGIRQLLSSASTSVVTFTPRQTGEFQFNCGMGMMSPWEARFIVVPAS